MIAGDLNVKVGQARSDTEKGIIGMFAVSIDAKKEAAGKGALDNKERLTNTCMEQGLKLINTGFDKPIEQRATYRPLKVKPSLPISDAAREQLDHVMARDQGNLRFKDCFTDTNEYLDSHHYPILAMLQIQCSKVKKLPPQHPQVQRQEYLKG